MRAAIYTRISKDHEGRRLGVQRQRQDCEQKAKTLGWKIAGTYEDNDRSASNGKRRPEYERLLEDIEARAIDAVVCWDLDRLHRRPLELEHFIDLADRHAVALASVGGDVDLATDNGRMFARIKGAVARAESERNAARQRRQKQQRAESGAPPSGRRAFGYSKDGTEIVEDEAEEIRKAAAAVLAGASIHSVERDLNARGVKTSTGAAWRNMEVRKILKNPRYAALRTYKGDIIGPGSWPEIIDEDTFYALRAVLNSPDRQKPGPPRRYLLSGVARCAVCDGRLFGVSGTYRCESRRHISRASTPVDDFIEQVIIERLSRPDTAELFARDDRSDEIARLREEEMALRARLDGLSEAFAAGEIDRRQLVAGTKRINTRLEQLSSDLATAVNVPGIADVVTADDVAAVWGALDIDRKRAILDVLMAIKVNPPGPGSRTFRPETVEIEWRE